MPMSHSRIYIATGNPSKLADFQQLISYINPEISVQMVPKKIEVKEIGKTIAENSKLKVTPYNGKYNIPVLANDFGLKFEDFVVELLDQSKAKRNALEEKDPSGLDQQEIGLLMLNFYNSVAKKYGGRIPCKALDIFSLLLPTGEIKQTNAIREYELVYREVNTFDIYHPLNSIRVSPKIGKFIDEFTEKDHIIDKSPLIDALRDLLKH
jgi:hypothetical protein